MGKVTGFGVLAIIYHGVLVFSTTLLLRLYFPDKVPEGIESVADLQILLLIHLICALVALGTSGVFFYKRVLGPFSPPPRRRRKVSGPSNHNNK